MIFLIIISLLSLFIYLRSRHNSLESNRNEIIKIKYINEKFIDEPQCICAFDIDGTITHSKDVAKLAVKVCKEYKCKLIINTARPGKYIKDIDLEYLDLSFNDDDFYIGSNIDKQSSHTYEDLMNQIAQKKVDNLFHASKKYNIKDLKNVILFDDLYENIVEARKNGFSAIHANNRQGGLNYFVVSDINKILKS